jgi:hypothetical protein
MNVFAYVCVPHTNMPALVLGRTSALEIRGLHTVSLIYHLLSNGLCGIMSLVF